MGDAVDQQERIPVRQDLQYILIVERKVIATVWRIRHVTHEGLVKVTIIMLAAQTETGVRVGYDKTPQREAGDAANWGFHPLFPLTAYPFRHWLKLSLPMSLVFASKAALLFAIYSFLLTAGDQAETTADRFRAGSLVAFNPYLVYAHAGYAEPLYFALLAFAFYLASRRRWIASGIRTALLSATRLIGFLFSSPTR